MATHGRAAYKTHAVETASPTARLLIVIDQLGVSLARANAGFDQHDLYEIHCGLKNAQEIVALLRGSLQFDAWEGAKDVSKIYDFALDRLVRANFEKDRTLLADAQQVLEPLMNAWWQAAQWSPANELAPSN